MKRSGKVGCIVGVSVEERIETALQLCVSYGVHGRSPLSVLPSHGRSSSSSPLHPFASHEMATSSEVSTAMRGDRLWVIESGGEGIFLPSLPFR